MSCRTKKRRIQRRRHLEKIKWWADYRQHQSDQAYKDWKEINAHLLEINRLELRAGH